MASGGSNQGPFYVYGAKAQRGQPMKPAQIKALRKTFGVSQEAFGRDLQITAAQVSNIELGKREVVTLIQIRVSELTYQSSQPADALQAPISLFTAGTLRPLLPVRRLLIRLPMLLRRRGTLTFIPVTGIVKTENSLPSNEV